MRPFAYEAPTTLEGAVSLLAAGGERARPLAGGTDLLVQMRRGLLAPDLLVDVKRIAVLNAASLDLEQGLTVGAALPLDRLCALDGVAAAYPALADAACLIGGTAIRSRATLGGNLCNAAPSADSVPAMIVLGATALVAGPAGTRTVPVERFCTAPGRTVLGPGELLVSIHFPPPQPRSGSCYLRFTPRGEMDIAVAGAGAWLALDGDGRVAAARIALAAVAPLPLLAEQAGAALLGRVPDGAAIAEAAALAHAAAQPIDDVRGTAAQRRHLVGVLTRRALREAVRRAQEEGSDGR